MLAIFVSIEFIHFRQSVIGVDLLQCSWQRSLVLLYNLSANKVIKIMLIVTMRICIEQISQANKVKSNKGLV